VTGVTPRAATTAVTEALADREARNPHLRWLVHVGLPLAVSVVVHLGLVAFLALKTFGALTRPGAELGQWRGSVVEAPNTASAFQWGEVSLPRPPAEFPDAASLENLTALPAVDDTDLRALERPDQGAATGSGLGLGEGSLSLLGTGTGAGEPGSGGFGSGLGGGTQLGQAGIWNLSIRANKIVYVVDFSGSIVVAVDELKRELKRSIGRLAPRQSFDVILFFSSGGGQDEKVRTESFKPKLEPADEATRREFFTWIDRKAPMGVTEPLDAMRRALALKPDAIFFFSDGYFQDSVVDEIQRANRSSQTRIFGLVFDELLLQDTSGLPRRETEGTRRLRQIAEASGGQVKIVTGKDLAR
jgi:hypothetical protein